MEEEANIIEQQMAVQHRLDTQSSTAATVSANKYEDFCLPAVFMPFKSANSVFNPRAHQYFHPSGKFIIINYIIIIQCSEETSVYSWFPMSLSFIY